MYCIFFVTNIVAGFITYNKGSAVQYIPNIFLWAIYSPPQKYWNGKANSFVFVIHWRHLGLRSKEEYETSNSLECQLLFPGIYI